MASEATCTPWWSRGCFSSSRQASWLAFPFLLRKWECLDEGLSLEGHRTHLPVTVDFKLEDCFLGWVQAGLDSF